MYFVCDVCDDSKYGKIMSHKEMYELLIDEIVEDAKSNDNDYDIRSECAKQLGTLAKNNLVSDKYVIEGLEGYGWKIIDLLEIQRDLEDLKSYFAPNDDTPLAISFKDVIDKINKGVK